METETLRLDQVRIGRTVCVVRVHGAGALRHLALAAEDTDACVAAVRAAGYEITMEPTDIVIPSNPPYPARIAFCIGPVGEELEFFHVK